jgi:hypothetical protein
MREPLEWLDLSVDFSAAYPPIKNSSLGMVVMAIAGIGAVIPA